MSSNSPSVKQQRAEQREEKLAAFRRQQAKQKRNRTIGIVLSVVGFLAVLAIVAVAVVVNLNSEPPRAREDIVVEGAETWEDLPFDHVVEPVDYEAEYGMNPPAGGAHSQQWLNCGVYTAPVPSERAVHSLEHAAIWATYEPDLVTDAELRSFRAILPSSGHVILSPFPGMDTPFALSAWGAQLKLDDPSVEAAGDFIEKYWRSPSAPEGVAACTGQPATGTEE